MFKSFFPKPGRFLSRRFFGRLSPSFSGKRAEAPGLRILLALPVMFPSVPHASGRWTT